MAMQDREGEHTVLRVTEEAANAWRPDLASLKIEQARYHLQIILHPVVNLTKHVVALLDVGAQRRLAAGDRFGHRRHAGADRGHFR